MTSYSILLYGATGFSGRLITELAAKRWASPTAYPRFELVLAARDRARLCALARRHDLEYRAFALDERRDVMRQLDGIDLVLNAAGPFALTAERLAKSAIASRCHYVDINGEVNVYKRLDDLGRIARERGVSVVCGAGHMSASSDLLIKKALDHLGDRGVKAPVTVRTAMSSILQPSRGSVYTLLRSLREQVTVAREDRPGHLVLWHAPVGLLQRSFDFGAARGAVRDLRIASAMNLVDTLTARIEAMRHAVRVNRIESYMVTGDAMRIGYRLGAMASPLLALPLVGKAARMQASLLPEGPTAAARHNSRSILILDIEDAQRTPVIDWRLEGPNIYDITADAVTKTVECLLGGASRDLHGWCTPAEVLGGCPSAAGTQGDLPLDGCTLLRRSPEHRQ